MHGILDRTVGATPLAVTIGTTPVSPTLLGPVTIRHGRDRPGTRPGAATCSLTISTAALEALPTVGAALTVDLGASTLTWAGLDLSSPARRRFTGHITNLTADTDTLTEPARLTIVATSRRARLGRVFLGDVPWPQENDAARAGRILSLAAAQLPGLTWSTDSGTVEVLPRDVDRQPALRLLDELAQDTGGELVELRGGELVWHDADHAAAALTAATLTASEVLSSTRAEQDLDGLVNSFTVGYGSDDPQDSVTVEDPDSIAAHGPASASLSTQLVSEADASLYATAMVSRFAVPRWRLSQLDVDLIRYDGTAGISPAQAAVLLALEQADLLVVRDFPVGGPFAAARLLLEGWTEHVSRNGWRLGLNVSDRDLALPGPTWEQLPPTLAWSDIAPTDTWLDLTDYPTP